jgi:hypothetical protein
MIQRIMEDPSKENDPDIDEQRIRIICCGIE